MEKTTHSSITEEHLASEAEKQKAIDPPDYFEITAFQKKASAIDTDPSHKWDSVKSHLLMEEDELHIAGGEVYNKEKDRMEFLLALKAGEAAGASVLMDNLGDNGSRDVFECVRSYVSCLPKDERERVVKEVIREAGEWDADTQVYTRFADKIFDVLPDIAETPDISGHEFFKQVEDPERKAELLNYLETVGRKTTPENFRQKFGDFTDSLRFRDDVFTRGYRHLFGEMLEWVVGSREDFKKNYDILQPAETEKYAIQDKITRKIDTQEELQIIIDSLESRSAPDTRDMQFSERQAEMVPLEKVMGAVLIEDGWNVSASRGRGVETIFKFVQGFQDGTIDLLGHNDPIKVIEINGEYFLDGDGRHRTAALKALGVQEVPMLVMHVQEAGASPESEQNDPQPSRVESLDATLDTPEQDRFLEQKEEDERLLALIPIQDRSFAMACADRGEEGLELFREMSEGSTYLDPETNAREKERLDAMIESLKKYREHKQARLSDANDLREARRSLDIEKVAEPFTETNVNSVDLASHDEAYRLTGKIEGVHYNASHEQDAFSIQEKDGVTCVTVCDGMSSKAGSGELSSRLSKELSGAALSRPLAEIFAPGQMTDILTRISNETGLLKGGAASTIVSARIDVPNNSIEWSSVGDSPLFVVDTDDEGNVVSWTIVTEESPLTNEDYTNMKTLGDLKDPRTHAVTLRENGDLSLPPEDRVKSGFIEFKKGRKLVLASDFITKVLLHSPEVASAYKKHFETATHDDDGNPYTESKKKAMTNVWGMVGDRNEREFADLWTKNPATGEMMINPLFMVSKSSEEVRTLLTKWMGMNTSSEDDVTVMAIDLDQYFSN